MLLKRLPRYVLSSMMSGTLYEQLGVAAQDLAVDHGRTEKSTALETIDKDRLVLDLYASLGDPVIAGDSDVGETDVTRQAPETVDRDRADQVLGSSLLGPPTDLYGALACSVGSAADDRGKTEGTIATGETIDRDRADRVLGSSLLGPPTDLYGALACSVGSAADDRGETKRTLATEETIDEGWAPDLPYT
jgi:hypothetical protein